MSGRIEIFPGGQSRIAFFHWDGVPRPLSFARFGIEGLKEAGLIEVIACSHENVIAHDDWRHRREILQIEIGDFNMPKLFAGFCVERDQVIVRRFHEETIAPHT